MAQYSDSNFPKGTVMPYLDYTIKHCKNNDGIVLLKDKPYEHHGNFALLSDAKHAAICHFMIARPEYFSADLYYRIISGRGQSHSYYLLRSELVKSGLHMPPEVECSGDGGIVFEGKSLCDRYPHLRDHHQPAAPNTEQAIEQFIAANLEDTKGALAAMTRQLLTEYHKHLSTINK